MVPMFQNLGMSCNNDFKSACSRKEKKVLKHYNGMSAAERQEIIKATDEEVARLTAEKDAEVRRTTLGHCSRSRLDTSSR